MEKYDEKTEDERRRRGELKNALYRKAVGYDATETVEEYSQTDGDFVLVKKKVTTKSVPPDIAAIKMLFEVSETDDLSTFSDEDLKKERERLLKIIKEN